MGCNVAFYDEKRGRLVCVERVSMPRVEAPIGAMMLGSHWQSGGHLIPSPWWVVWDNLDDLTVFSLHPCDSGVCPDEAMLDRIFDLAREASAK